MPSVVHVTKYVFDGPWLIDRKDLIELDALSARIEQSFIASADEQLRQEAITDVKKDQPFETPAEYDELVSEQIARLKRYRSEPPARKVQFLLEDLRRVRGNSIEELLRQPDVMTCPTIAIEIEHHGYFDADTSYLTFFLDMNAGELKINGYPDESTAISENFNELQQWALDRQPPTWEAIWMKLAWFSYPIALGFIVERFLEWTSSREGLHTQLKSVATTLLEGGIDPAKTTKAVELLLRAEFNIPLPGAPEISEQFPLFWALGLIAIATFVYLSRPRPALGIGPTSGSPNSRRMITRWVSWILPATIFTAVVIPKLLAKYWP